jgi:hypothetical protein
MLDSFEFDGVVRRYAFAMNADAFLHVGKLTLFVLLHDRDQSALEFLQASEAYARLLGPESAGGAGAKA